MKRTPNLNAIGSNHYPFPLDIIVETCAFCNLRCTICPHPTLKRPKGEMEFDVFKKIVDEVAGKSPDSRFWVAIMGEPLLRGDKLVEMLTYAKNQGLDNIYLNTNATFLTKDMTHKLLDSGIKELLISMDANTKETYDKIRVGGDFHETIKNIEYFLAAKQEKGLQRPAVIMQFIIMDENEHEIEQFKEYWLKRKAIVKVRLKLGWGTAVQAGDLIAADIKRDFPCPWLLRSVSIHWDGKFAVCDADYEAVHSPGDIKTQTIQEVWDGELAKRRERHWALDFSYPPCDICRDWSVGRAAFHYPEEEKKQAVACLKPDCRIR